MEQRPKVIDAEFEVIEGPGYRDPRTWADKKRPAEPWHVQEERKNGPGRVVLIAYLLLGAALALHGLLLSAFGF